VRAHQVLAGGVRSEASRDLAHRREQWQSAALVPDGLVRDGGDLGVQEGVGQCPVGGQVQVGEQRAGLTQVAVLGRDGFLDLQDEVGPPGVRGVRQLGSGALIGGGVDAVAGEDSDAGVGEGDASFGGLDLLDQAYAHGGPSWDESGCGRRVSQAG
jgi:hypothetical protein